MTLALLAFVLVPQLRGAAGDEERVFLWPLGSGYAPYELRATYGQPEGKGKRLHEGLDVSDRSRVTGARSRSVYALEDGTVRRVHVDGAVNYVSGVVVESKAVPGRAWLYLHLEKDSIRFAEGEEVRINEILGDVLDIDTVTGVPHVHLARLGGDFRGERWERITALSERNPLALLRPDALGDATAPTVEIIEGETFHFRNDESEDAYSAAALSASTAASPLATDVLACVRDGDGGPHALAPYRLKLVIQGVPAQTFQLCLDGPLPSAATICHRRERASSPPPYDLLFVLTNGAEECGPGLLGSRTWEPETGEHTLELTVEDVSEYRTTAVHVVRAEVR